MKIEEKEELVKLKTIDQIKAEFIPISDYHEEYSDGELELEYNNLEWFITEEMLPTFGSQISLVRMFKIYEKDEDYTHYCEENDCWYHELWFENEFIKEEEMIV